MADFANEIKSTYKEKEKEKKASYLLNYSLVPEKGSAIAQSVERRVTPGEDVPFLIPAVAAGSLLVGLLSVYNVIG